MKYYIAVNQKYGIDTENGLRTYIHDMLAKKIVEQENSNWRLV